MPGCRSSSSSRSLRTTRRPSSGTSTSRTSIPWWCWAPPPTARSSSPTPAEPHAVDGAYLEQAASLYLGEDAAQIPTITTFNTWVQRVSPGFTTDFFTLTGWLCGELFVDALRNAGTNPSRGSLLAGPAEDHHVRQRESRPGEQPGGQGTDHLLPAGPDRRRQVPATRRSAGDQPRPTDSAATGPTTGQDEVDDRMRSTRGDRWHGQGLTVTGPTPRPASTD